MWNRPGDCLRWLSMMASTWKINATELGLRGLAGAALIVRSPSAKAPDGFEVAGWFILASSVALLLTPRRVHAAYAVWWSKKLPEAFVRSMSPITAVVGVVVIYLAI